MHASGSGDKLGARSGARRGPLVGTLISAPRPSGRTSSGATPRPGCAAGEGRVCAAAVVVLGVPRSDRRDAPRFTLTHLCYRRCGMLPRVSTARRVCSYMAQRCALWSPVWAVNPAATLRWAEFSRGGWLGGAAVVVACQRVLATTSVASTPHAAHTPAATLCPPPGLGSDSAAYHWCSLTIDEPPTVNSL